MLAKFAPVCALALVLSAPFSAFAVEQPAPLAQSDEQEEGQSVEPVHLGIIPDSTASAFDQSSGVLIKRVEPGTTAADMGLKPGDVITHFNNKPILRIHDLKMALEAQRVGNQARIGIKRDGQVLELAAELRAKLRPADLEKTAKELEKTRHLLSKARKNPNDLGRNLRHLALALNDLPERVETAATEFKKIYPDGEFTVNIEIKITSNKKSKAPMSIKLGEGGEMPTMLDDAGEPEESDPAAESVPKVPNEP